MKSSDETSGRSPELRPFTVVTGGSDGIGLAIAQRLAAKGHHLLLVARTEQPLRAAADALRNQGDGQVQVLTLALDVTAPDAPQRIEAALADAGAYADLLVNNAGMGLSGTFADQPAADLEALLALNITALTRLTRHFAPAMRARRRGGFLNVASLAGYVPGPYQAAYYASKAYAVSLSESLAAELRPDGVRVTVLAPGPVATRFHAKMNAEHSLYRRLLPAPSPAYVAWWAVTGYTLGLRLVVPGVLSLISFVALRFMPHRLVIPVVGTLLKPRLREGSNA